VSDGERLLAVILAGVAILVALPLWRVWRERRRNEVVREPFPAEWRAYLHRGFPLYRRLPRELQLKLEPVVRSFLADVRFVGCQGFEITDEVRLVIATQACLLVVERDQRAYAGLSSVLVYPDEFVITERHEDEAGVVSEAESAVQGQSEDDQRIILSWRDVMESAADADAYHVVLHEFAHYLDNSVGGLLTDTESGSESLKDWHDVLAREYQALCDAVDDGEETLIDDNAAEHPAEFFAYATEAFFEKPAPLARQHPALYAELRSFYGLDPATW
jgi:Mlc titration factor MtfA (ptsG expression regulator)